MKFTIDIPVTRKKTKHGYYLLYRTGGSTSMTPFQPAQVTEEDKRKLATAMLLQWRDGDRAMRKSFGDSPDGIEAAIEEYVEESSSCAIFKNDIYQVQVREIEMFGQPGVWLSIKRIDREPIHDWRHMQQIKNELVGPECEGIQLYPAESRVVDTSNQYHAWCFRNPEIRFPVGFDEGLKSEGSLNGSKQRPFETA